MKIVIIVVNMLFCTICLSSIDTTFVIDNDKQIKSLNGICSQVKVLNEVINNTNGSMQTEIRNLNEDLKSIISEQTDSISSIFGNNSYDTISSKKNDFDFYEFLGSAIIEAIGAFIGFGGALFLYYHQKKNEKVEEKEELNKQNIFKIKYLKLLFKDCLNLINNQIIKLEENNKRIEAETLYLFQPDLYPIEDLKRLQNLFNNQEYFNAYINIIGSENDDTKDLRNIIGSIDYFINQFLEFRKTDGIELDHKRKLNYKEYFEEALKKVVFFGESNEKRNKNIYSDINVLIGSYAKNLGKLEDIKLHQEKFIEPALKLILDKYYNDNGAKECLEILRKTTQTYHDIRFQNSNRLNLFKEQTIRLKDIYNKLDNNSIKLKSFQE